MRSGTDRAGGLATLVAGIVRLLDAIPYALVALFARLVVAHAFFVSGQTKVEGSVIGGEIGGLDLSIILPAHIRDSAFTLFADEYKVPVLPSGLATYLATFAEHLLPVLLLLGLASRFSALGLIGMTMVIQIFVYPDAWWTVHAYWLGLLLLVVSKGPGAFSLDHLIAFSWRSRAPEERIAGPSQSQTASMKA